MIVIRREHGRVTKQLNLWLDPVLCCLIYSLGCCCQLLPDSKQFRRMPAAAADAVMTMISDFIAVISRQVGRSERKKCT